MPRYGITEKAGRFVAGLQNHGVGSVLTLTEKQAEHELRLGTLVPLDVQRPDDLPKKAPVPEPAAEPAKEPAPAKEPVDDLEDMTVAELKALAAEMGLELDSDWRKADIVAAIAAARADTE